MTAEPARSRRLGMARTFQNLQLVPSLTVIENVMLGVRRAALLATRSCRLAGLITVRRVERRRA